MTRENRQSGTFRFALQACALALAVLWVGRTSPASAQSPSLQITSVSTEGWPALEITATILDAGGQPVTGLAPGAFAGSIDGQPVPVQGLQTTSDPGVGIAVVMTFDVSGSMAGAPLANAAAAGRALLSQLGPSDQAAVIAFANQPVVVQPFTQDRAALGSAIDSLAAGGNTSLYAAVQESVRLASSAPFPRRAIVLLSDGHDYGGLAVDPQAALASVQNGSAVFMSIGLGDAIDQDYLAALAAAGHGQFRAAPTPDGLTALYQETAQVLRQQYVVTFDARSVDPLRAQGKAIRVQATVGGTVLTGEAILSLPPALLATPVPTAAPPSEPAPRTEPAAESGGSALPFVILGVVGAAAAVAGAAVLWLRRRRRFDEEGSAGLGRIATERFDLETKPLAYPTIQRAASDESGAWLETPEQRVPLGDNPVTIGYTSDANVVLANGTGSRTERVRIWLRDGSYMLHNLSRAGAVTIAGKPVTWAVLEDGDEIRIGGQTLVFRAAEHGPEI